MVAVDANIDLYLKCEKCNLKRTFTTVDLDWKVTDFVYSYCENCKENGTFIIIKVIKLHELIK